MVFILWYLHITNLKFHLLKKLVNLIKNIVSNIEQNNININNFV